MSKRCFAAWPNFGVAIRCGLNMNVDSLKWLLSFMERMATRGNRRPPNPWCQYAQASDVAPYFQLAGTYTFGDRMFQTNQGPSFPAHRFILSGTSAPSAGSNLFASENPVRSPDPFDNAGCIAPPNEVVALITPTGDETQEVSPCFDHPTLTDI